MTDLWRLIRLLPQHRARTAGILLTSAMAGLVGIASPFVVRHVVDTLAHGRTGVSDAAGIIRHLLWASAVFVALRLIIVVIGAIQHRQSAHLWLDNVGSLRHRIFEEMSGASLGHYEQAQVGDIMDRFASIVPVTHWLRDLVEGTLASALQLCFSLIVLFAFAPVAGLVMLVAMPANIWLSWRSLAKTRPHRKRWQQLGGRMSALLSEMMSQIVTVRAFGGEGALRHRFGDAHRAWQEARLAEWRIDRLWSTALLGVNGLALSLVLLLAVGSALEGRSSVGDVILVITLAQAVITLVQPISRAIIGAGEAEAGAERLVDLLDIVPDVIEHGDAIELGPIHTLEFDRVSFTYPGQQTPALQEISFAVRAGQTLALVGPSGSGKSSLVKLLLRFYEPSAGAIRINGRDIADYSLSSLRARVGVVLQDVALFNDSIARNIAFAREESTPDEIARAARMSHADEFIRRLPEGYETQVGERGAKLSGGERQRISVARAMLRDPDLVILDEATSALDSESERLVQTGLEQLMRDRTAIVIAHRLSSVRHADTILVLSRGVITERGRHEELMQRGGIYHRLHSIQRGEPEETRLTPAALGVNGM